MIQTDQPKGADRDFITLRLPRAALYGLVGLLAGGLIGFFISRASSDSPKQETALSTNVEPSPPTTVKVSVSGRPSRGPEGAKVTVVEFTDYECPFCKRHFNETYPALIAAYEGRIRYVVRNFPLARHPLAPKAAEAAECAHEQGRFWEYHDVLFRTEALDLESLKRHATGLGLDRSRFDQCLDSGAKAEVVRQDMEDGRRYGVSATPTFFINGEKLTGAKSLDVFRKMIDDRLR